MIVFKSAVLTSNLYKNLLKIIIVSNSRTVSTQQDVIFESIKDKGVITLNRPNALNAINLSMANKLLPKLKQWEKEKMFVLIKGAGGKAFSAGGDVRAVVDAGLKGDRYGQDLFRKVYFSIALVGTYGIPYIALIDGFVTGGSNGLSVNGHYRVATERTVFGLPETEIGLFPDASASYYLPRLRGKLGMYLGLTGYRLTGIDVLKAGIATHFIESHKQTDLETALLDCTNEHNIKDILKKFSKRDGTEFSLAPYLPQINKCFGVPTVEGIFEELKKDGSEWAQNTLKTLKKMSPTSLKISFNVINMGSKLSLQECLEIEYRLAMNLLANKDFYEG